ncbi:MAG: hypothetical protein ABI165_18765 [Bryobacteraceae bacterium]
MRCCLPAVLTALLVFPISRSMAESIETPVVVRTERRLDLVRELVAQGVLPAARVRDAELAVEDARDEAILNATLYGNLRASDLTESQAREMTAAAGRRLARQQATLERSRELVAGGAEAWGDLNPLEAELERRQSTVDLAAGRARLIEEIAAMARAEADAARREAAEIPETPEGHPVMERFSGAGVLTTVEVRHLTLDFEKQFDKPLPVSARGETEVHRMMGLDHRGRIDVALNPDEPEGVWLRHYLTAHAIPYFAFRAAIEGAATAPHIHIGPGSTKRKGCCAHHQANREPFRAALRFARVP